MIRQVTDKAEINCKKLLETCAGKRLLSNLEAYGTDYDFCRFYISDSDSVLLFMNDTLLISGDGFEKDELTGFAGIHTPFRIEGNQKAIGMLSDLSGYRSLHRTLFKLVPDSNIQIDENDIERSPKLDDVYGILSEGFPNLIDFSLWLADTSHRVRHNISQVFVYRKSTTASVVYDIDNTVLIGQVATKISARGSGYARKFLKWIAQYLSQQGKTAFLNALDTRESFYREIGFEPYESEYVLERIDDRNESAVKGKLSTND